MHNLIMIITVECMHRVISQHLLSKKVGYKVALSPEGLGTGYRYKEALTALIFLVELSVKTMNSPLTILDYTIYMSRH